MNLGYGRRLTARLSILVTLIVAIGLVSAVPASAKQANTNTMCANYQVARTMWAANFPVAHVNVQLCVDGSRVWQNGGANCYVQQLSGSIDTTWCGVYNNGGSFVEPGINFTEHYPWGGNFPGCYLRFHVTAGGSITNVWWGGC